MGYISMFKNNISDTKSILALGAVLQCHCALCIMHCELTIVH
jgi:hypothetical protein